MANSEHLEVLKRGVHVWNQWRDRNPDVRPDLRAAYLREADLERYNLQDADLRAAVLLGANLRDARLEGADLAFSDLRFVDVKGACLHDAKLREAKGVTDDLRRALKPPVPWGRRAAWGTLALLLLLAGGYVYRSPQAVHEITALASEKVGELWDREAEALARKKRGPAPEPPTTAGDEIGPTIEQAHSLEADLAGLHLPGWSIVSVEVRATVLAMRIDASRVDQDVYIPTLAAACAAVVTHRLMQELSEIHVLNRTGDHGWIFQQPRGCEVLIETPPAVLRMAAAADSIEFEKPRPGRP